MLLPPEIEKSALRLCLGQLLLCRLGKSGLFLRHVAVQCRKFLLNFLDAFDEQLHVGLFLTCFRKLLNDYDYYTVLQIAF